MARRLVDLQAIGIPVGAPWYAAALKSAESARTFRVERGNQLVPRGERSKATPAAADQAHSPREPDS